MSELPASKVLLPLYIYPHPGAWEPLYLCLNKHTRLQIIVIVNPDNGPGAEPWWPNEDYVREVSRLSTYANVTIVGYVHATYCQRALPTVLDDVETYALRTGELNGQRIPNSLNLRGIFVDETVNLYTEESKAWLDSVDCKVKSCRQFGPDGIVIHNPGTAVNPRLATPGPDVTVVVETSYEHFITEEYQDWLATSPYNRSQSCYMIHSVPIVEVQAFTKALRKQAGHLFVTSATSGFYESWSPSWEAFISGLDAS
ncbi:hypothetical protein ACN47E_009293 [Coniothyrium glycines]